VLVFEAILYATMLAEGPYPDVVRRRIGSRTGHLSNTAAGHLARACVHPQLRHIVLAHISEQCNTPRVALSTVSAALAGSRFRGRLNVAAQDVVCGVGVAAGRNSRAAQLSLAL
jgi:phosphoribosyl 1,2-cyclic phosphodiesterase